MKKAILFLMAAVLLFSCEDNSYPEDLTTKQTFNLKVNANDWTEYTGSSGERYYYCFVKINEITNTIYERGSVTAYIDYDDRQQVLPYVRHMRNSAGSMWTRTIDYDVTRDGVTFYVTNSDFAIDPPGTMYFRVLLMW